jgi:K+-sensing histidine kinase KdpD
MLFFVVLVSEIPENDEVDEENTQEELAEESEDESEKVTEPVNDLLSLPASSTSSFSGISACILTGLVIVSCVGVIAEISML